MRLGLRRGVPGLGQHTAAPQCQPESRRCRRERPGRRSAVAADESQNDRDHEIADLVLVGAALVGDGSKLYARSRAGLRLLEARVLPGSQLVELRYDATDASA